MIEKVDLVEKLALFDEHWSPKIVAELNDTYVKVVKLEGEFVWHHHDDEDELFLVVSGRLRMQFRDGDVVVEVGGRVSAGVPFDVVLPAAAEVEVLVRIDTPERAVGRLAHHLHDISMVRIDPDVDYLRRAVAAYRHELRLERDRAGTEAGSA